MRYIYFCSYAYLGGFGNVTVLRECPLDSSEKIEELQLDIARYNKINRVVILNFVLLKKEKRHGGK